jgi:5'-nucleotidase
VGLDGRSATPIRTAEANLGNLLADSLLWHGTVYGSTLGTPIPTIAITNGGGIRNNSIIGPGLISVLNTFDIAPFNNTAVVVPNVSPARLKQLLENCVANVPGTPGGGSDTGRFGQISGFTFTWNSQGTRQLTTTSNIDVYTRTNTITQQGTRIVDVTLNDGTAIIRNGAVVPGAPNVNIATVDFLAQGGDQYKLEDLPNVRLGAFTYQLVLENYIRQWLGGDINGMNYPATGERRIIRRN